MNTKDKHMSVPLLDANPYRLILQHLDLCLVIIWRNFKFCRFLFAVSLRQTTESQTHEKKYLQGLAKFKISGEKTFFEKNTR